MNMGLQVSPFVHSQSTCKILSESMTDICIRIHQSLSVSKPILFKYSRIHTFSASSVARENVKRESVVGENALSARLLTV